MHTRLQQNTDSKTRRVARKTEGSAPELGHLSTHSDTDTRLIVQRKAGCTCGGGCPGCQDDDLSLQPKLQVNQPDDRFEQEADRVADRVVGMQSAAPSPMTVSSATTNLSAKSETGLQVNAGTASAISSLRGKGQPMPANDRAFFEPRFGADLSGVRIHTGSKAAKTAQSINARAFTTGNDIVFGAGEYAPGTSEGRRLMAHELTHTIQQNGASEKVQRFTAAECKASGCTPATRCDSIQEDFERAERYVARAKAAMGQSTLAGHTQDALRWYFHRDSDTANGDIANRLDLIETALLVTDIDGDFTCQPASSCSALAYVNTDTAVDTLDRGPINVCEAYFGLDAKNRAITLIHEAAHLAGMSVSTDDVYEHTQRFRNLPESQAILNADSYALFAAAIATGNIGLSLLLELGAFAGPAFNATEQRGWMGSLYLDATFQHPVMHLFNPTLRLSASVVGIPESGPNPDSVLDDSSYIFGILPGFRIENPRPSGVAPYLSVFGGPSVNVRDGNVSIGAQAGIGAGIRWQWLDIGVGGTYIHDPTADGSFRNILVPGASLNIVLPVIGAH